MSSGSPRDLAEFGVGSDAHVDALGRERRRENVPPFPLLLPASRERGVKVGGGRVFVGHRRVGTRAASYWTVF